MLTEIVQEFTSVATRSLMQNMNMNETFSEVIGTSVWIRKRCSRGTHLCVSHPLSHTDMHPIEPTLWLACTYSFLLPIFLSFILFIPLCMCSLSACACLFSLPICMCFSFAPLFNSTWAWLLITRLQVNVKDNHPCVSGDMRAEQQPVEWSRIKWRRWQWKRFSWCRTTTFFWRRKYSDGCKFAHMTDWRNHAFTQEMTILLCFQLSGIHSRIELMTLPSGKYEQR